MAERVTKTYNTLKSAACKMLQHVVDANREREYMAGDLAKAVEEDDANMAMLELQKRTLATRVRELEDQLVGAETEIYMMRTDNGRKRLQGEPDTPRKRARLAAD